MHAAAAVAVPAAALRRARPVLADLDRPEQVGVVLLALMWLAQVTIPLTDRRTGPTNAVVLLLAGATTAFACGRRAGGPTRAVAALVAIPALGLAVELVGTGTGWPFGSYAYTGVLRPTVAGIPAAVVLAWWGMGLPAWAVASRLGRSTWERVAVGAVALTGWDLFLDPQMVGEGYWRFDGGGVYRSIPLTNFAGWLLASALVMVVLAILVPRAGGSTPLVATYALMAAMEALGFVVFFGDPLVGLLGAVVTFPLAAVALRRG